MAVSPPGDIEELARCSWCRRAFSDARAPKLLACKHHFCLDCARGPLAAAAGAVRCAHCARRTDPPAGRAERLPTHGAVLALARRLRVTTPPPPPDEPRDEARALHAELRVLAARRRAVLLLALHAAAALRARLEAELAVDEPPPPPDPAASPAAERDRLRRALADAALRARIDDAVRSAPGPLDFEHLRRALAGAGAGASGAEAEEPRDPLVFLANYCLGAAWLQRGGGGAESPVARALGGGFPLLFFELEVDGARWGRVVVEARCDVAPKMARNFEELATGAGGAGYRGCAVFQCWADESVIAGDVEAAGRGGGGGAARGRGPFLPDDSRLSAVRGAVGMRRSQKRHDNLGLVASQFRIVLREMRGFSAIFGFVAEGLELVDRLSRTGDSAGKPHKHILIANCGRLN